MWLSLTPDCFWGTYSLLTPNLTLTQSGLTRPLPQRIRRKQLENQNQNQIETHFYIYFVSGPGIRSVFKISPLDKTLFTQSTSTSYAALSLNLESKVLKEKAFSTSLPRICNTRILFPHRFLHLLYVRSVRVREGKNSSLFFLSTTAMPMSNSIFLHSQIVDVWKTTGLLPLW